MTEPAAVAASDLQQPGMAPAKTSADPAKMNITLHFGQGVPVPDDMKANAVSSAEPIRDRVIETFRGMGVSEDVLQQARERTPISENEARLAQHKKASLLGDRAWVQRYLEGDMECRRVMGTLSILLGSPIKSADEK